MIPTPIRAIVDARDEHACAIEGCERRDQCAADGQRVCLMHYKRWVRRGEFGPAEARPLRKQRGTCTVDGCESVDDGANGLCKLHGTRLRRHGDPLAFHPVGSPAGPDHHSRNDGGLTYSGAHIRVRLTKGRASDHACIDCLGSASQWSYDHLDPNERRGDGGPYSIDPDHYQPRCGPCHKAFDLAFIRGAR